MWAIANRIRRCEKGDNSVKSKQKVVDPGQVYFRFRPGYQVVGKLLVRFTSAWHLQLLNMCRWVFEIRDDLHHVAVYLENVR